MQVILRQILGKSHDLRPCKLMTTTFAEKPQLHCCQSSEMLSFVYTPKQKRHLRWKWAPRNDRCHNNGSKHRFLSRSVTRTDQMPENQPYRGNTRLFLSAASVKRTKCTKTPAGRTTSRAAKSCRRHAVNETRCCGPGFLIVTIELARSFATAQIALASVIIVRLLLQLHCTNEKGMRV